MTRAKSRGTSSLIVTLAGVVIIAIPVFQTVTHGGPDPTTLAALSALAVGGGVGRVADTLLKGFIQAKLDDAASDEDAA